MAEQTPNHFRVSDAMARPLELLLRSTGSPVSPGGEPGSQAAYDAASDAKWAEHAHLLTQSVIAGLPARLDWNSWSTALVLTIGADGNQVRYIIGRNRLFDAVQAAERLTQERRDRLRFVVPVRPQQLQQLRDLVNEWGYRWQEGDDPEVESELYIVEEQPLDSVVQVRLSAFNAHTAYSFGYVWQQLVQPFEPDSLDRDVPGVFQIWERDIAEVRENPANLDGVGACEPHQFEEMALPDLATLSRIIVWLYDQWQEKDGDTNLVWAQVLEAEGENADDWEEGMDEGHKGFANYLTFDCRQYLKREGGQGE